MFSPVKSTCRLERLLHVKENIILQATLEEYEDVRDNMSYGMLQREKVSVRGGTMEGTRHGRPLNLLEMSTNHISLYLYLASDSLKNEINLHIFWTCRRPARR